MASYSLPYLLLDKLRDRLRGGKGLRGYFTNGIDNLFSLDRLKCLNCTLSNATALLAMIVEPPDTIHCIVLFSLSLCHIGAHSELVNYGRHTSEEGADKKPY